MVPNVIGPEGHTGRGRRLSVRPDRAHAQGHAGMSAGGQEPACAREGSSGGARAPVVSGTAGPLATTSQSGSEAKGAGSSSGAVKQQPERELDGRRGQGWRARRASRGQAGERAGPESDGGRVAHDETGPVKKEEEGGRRLTGPCRCAYAGSGRRTRTGEVEAAVLR